MKNTEVAKEPSATNPSGNLAIERAAHILRALEQNPLGLSLGEIADLTQMPRSTVQRIVDALDRVGFVIASTATTRVRLGPALIPLAAATRFEIADMVRPLLVKLARTTGESVDLAVLGQDKLTFIDHVAGHHRLRTASVVGVTAPLHSLATGKAFLAALPDAELGRLRKHLKLQKFTPSTWTDWKDIDREIEMIRASGVAFDREEYHIGICAVASVIKGPTGELVAISIPVPKHRFDSNEKALVAELLNCCETFKRLYKNNH